MNEYGSICKYLDIPLQHISDHMLRAMRRGTNRDSTYRLIETIRSKVPGIALRTTLMTGFTGETEQDFEELCRFVEDTRFDRLGVFTYSHEEQTHAHSYKDDVPPAVKEQRAAALMKIQQNISQQLNQLKVGREMKVLFDRKENNYFVGRTEYDSPEVDNEVWVPAENNYVRLGDFARVRITEAAEFELYGVPVE